MKRVLMVATIVALMAVIFCSGVWFGRTTAESDEDYVAMDSEAVNAGRRTSAYVRKIERKYGTALNLRPDQRRQLRELVVETEPRMSALPQRSEERKAELRAFHGKLDEFLDEQQKAVNVELLEKAIEK